MKFKLDENLDPRLAEELIAAGHDATSVLAQNLGGAGDPHLWDKCREEDRCLITMDLGFANLLAYPPSGTPGLIVLRPQRQLLPLIRWLFDQLLRHLRKESPAGALWIVESGRIRIHRGREG